MDTHNVDSVKEVLAKTLLFDFALQVSVGRRDDASIEGLLLIAPDGANRSLLKGPKELCLHASGHLADLVEQQPACLWWL